MTGLVHDFAFSSMRLFGFSLLALWTVAAGAQTTVESSRKAQELSVERQGPSGSVLASLANTPKKCVSLSPGQICTERVLITWQAARRGNYCLNSNQQEQPLACWQSSDSGEFKFVFKSSTDMLFSLTTTVGTSAGNEAVQVLATSSVVVAWVYRKKRRGGWNWRSIWKVF